MSETRDTPIGKVVMLGTTEQNDKQQKIFYARYKFVKEEAQRRGWDNDIEKLSLTQLLEINEMDEWKNPEIN